MWFFQDNLWSGSLPLEITLLDFPRQGVFQVADPLNGLILTPIVPLLGLSVSYTLLVLGHVTFSGVGAHLLARHLHGSDRAGWIAGVAFACAPVLLSGIHNGTSEAIAGGWLALSALALLRAAERGGRAPILWASLGLVLVCLGGWYAGLCAWLFWGVLLCVGRPEVPWKSSFRRLSICGALALTLCVPMAVSMSQSVQEGSQIGIKNERELNTVRRSTGSADPLGWIAPGDWRSPDFREISRDNEEFIHSHYLGWTLILGAGFVLLRRRKGLGALALAGLAAGLLAMGPVLVRGGQAWVFSENLAVPLPYLLVEDLPGFQSLSLLFRLGLLPALALAVIAGGMAAHLKERWWILLALVFVELRFLSPLAGLPAVETARLSPALQSLAEAPPGAVMNYPIVGGRPYLYEQTQHKKPIAGLLNFPNNASSKKIWSVLDAVRSQPLSGARQQIRSVAQKTKTGVCSEIRPFCVYGILSQAPSSNSCRCHYGVRYLVLHEDELARPDMHQESAAWAAQSLPVLASDEGLKVIQLW